MIIGADFTEDDLLAVDDEMERLAQTGKVSGLLIVGNAEHLQQRIGGELMDWDFMTTGSGKAKGTELWKLYGSPDKINIKRNKQRSLFG